MLNEISLNILIRRKKLISQWRKTQTVDQNGITTIGYTNVTAFKFPDKHQVYLTCNVEVNKKYFCFR